jgi:hypothetical protein
VATLGDLVNRIDRLVQLMEDAEAPGRGATARGITGAGRDPADLRDQARELEDIAAVYGKINSLRATEAKQDRMAEAAKKRVLALQQEINEAAELGDDIAVKGLLKELEKLEEREDLIRKSKQSADDLSDSFGSIFSGKAPDLKGMLDPKNIQNLAKQYKSASMTMSAAQMASKAAVVALIAYTKAIVDLVVELDESEVAFMKATGANRDFARSITNSYQETRKFGASAKETSDAAQELFGSFTDFTMVSKDVRENLIETSTVLAKMGVSNQDFAKSIQTSTKALGMSADQAAQNMLNLEKFAENLGVAPQQLAADFANAGDMVAKLGQNGTKAFKDLQVVMKVTGMSMDSILSITNKFDTFEGAAEMAGKLNAAIGGNFVNAMDLMMAKNPAERFEMIRDSILDSGLAFDDMSYYQKQFYADSMGLKDVNELALMMSGNIDLMDGAIQQSQQSMVDAAQRARDLETIQQKLQTAFAQLIPIITPLIDAFSEMAGFVSDNIAVIKPLLGLLIAVASVLLTVASGGTLGAGGIAGLTLGFGLMFDSVETGGESLTLLGAIFEGLFFPFQAIYEVGKLLYGMFMDMIGPLEEQKELMETLAYIGKALGVVLGVVLVAAIGSIIGPVTAVVAGIGAAIAMIYSFASALFETPFNPPSFLIGLMEIGDAFLMMAEKAMEILNPFNAVERAIRAIGETFSSILGGVSSFFTAITDPAGAENIARIAKAISEVKPVPAAAFATAMTATAGAQTAGAAAAAVQGATEMVNNLVFGGASGTTDRKQEITVNLMLDRQKLATVVREINAKSATDAIAERA